MFSVVKMLGSLNWRWRGHSSFEPQVVQFFLFFGSSFKRFSNRRCSQCIDVFCNVDFSWFPFWGMCIANFCRFLNWLVHWLLGAFGLLCCFGTLGRILVFRMITWINFGTAYYCLFVSSNFLVCFGFVCLFLSDLFAAKVAFCRFYDD